LQPLAFVMTRPPYDAPTLPMEFRLTSEPGKRPYALEELIARVKAGGRQDVLLSFAGDIKHATTEDAVANLKAAGLVALVPAEFTSSMLSEPSPKVSGGTGHGRGWYGPRGWNRA
jgi:hypothetical protein